MTKKQGFYISRLTLEGESKPKATIDFSSGCNIITGASNTGKTFILQCIDFMFGAGTPPKDIPQANGYKNIFLEIKTHEGKVFTLMRSLVDSNKTYKTNTPIEGYWEALEKQEFDLFNSKNVVSDTSKPLSDFLLKLSGFEGDEVLRKNAKNTKKRLSFRDISHLTIVDEETIIQEKSPVFTMSNINETAEAAAFELLITGEDSGDLIDMGNVKNKRTHLKAQIELIEKMSKDIAEKISLNQSNINDDISIEQEIKRISEEYTEIQKTLDLKIELRKKVWLDLEKSLSSATSLQELIERFKILKSQYEIDLGRLDFIDEGEYLFSQLNSNNKCKCPVCDSIIAPSSISTELRNSIKAESRKIRLNLEELKATISLNEEEKNNLERKIKEEQITYNECSEEITKQLEPYKNSIQAKLENIIKKQNKLLKLNSFRTQITSLGEKLEELKIELGGLKNSSGSKGEINKTKLEAFVQQTKIFLSEWKYMKEEAVVTFDKDQNILDIKIDNIPRSSNGKGVRALIYTAFILGILKHCYKENLAHPLIALLDTPLNSYKGKDLTPEDRNGKLPEEVKNAFFENISQLPKDLQVIIFENEKPPENVIEKIKYHYFSGTEGVGRAAFIPIKKESL